MKRVRTLASIAAVVLMVSAIGCSVGSSDSSGQVETTKAGGTQSEPPPSEDSKRSGVSEKSNENAGDSPTVDNSEDRAEDKVGENAEKSSREPETGSADAPLVVVDKDHDLSPSYVPDDLAQLHPLGIQTLRGKSMELRQDAARAASEMLLEANSRGIELVVNSAYRSHEDQVISRERLIAIYGEQAEEFVALPGHSEHQLGTAIDVSNAVTGYKLTQRFGSTQAYEWLDENAVDYGFVLSYPREAKEITGYRWEPWHYRYIGPENARTYAEGNYESPQSFFLKEGVLPGGPARQG